MQSPFDTQMKQAISQLNPNGIIYKTYQEFTESQQLIEPYMKAFLNTPIEDISTRNDLLVEIGRLITRTKRYNSKLLHELMPTIGQQTTEEVYKKFVSQTKQHNTHVNEIMAQYEVPFPAFVDNFMYKY